MTVVLRENELSKAESELRKLTSSTEAKVDRYVFHAYKKFYSFENSKQLLYLFMCASRRFRF